MCAGLNISVTYWALSSCRDMRTCAVIGQAVATASAGLVAKNEGDTCTVSIGRWTPSISDSGVNQDHRMTYHCPLHDPRTLVAETLVRAFLLQLCFDGQWRELCSVFDNRQCLVRMLSGTHIALATTVDGVRLTPHET